MISLYKYLNSVVEIIENLEYVLNHWVACSAVQSNVTSSSHFIFCRVLFAPRATLDVRLFK